MSLNSIIRARTEAKELRLSREFVLAREEFEALGAEYLGSLGTAAQKGYFTARECERKGQPATDEEFASISHFAMFKDCLQENCLHRNGKSVRPCLPVFFRGEEKE
ncbi:MAG: hypothetical protein IJW89_03670 [Clostridia bacterium]|nr:hypothetical protein [Clostridia bacterium]